MNSTNRRQLARVRNAFLGATALAGFAALATPASAIVINDNFTPTQAVDTAGGVNGVGQMVVDEQNGFIGLCTVSLINPRTVIFASHCVNENPDENCVHESHGLWQREWRACRSASSSTSTTTSRAIRPSGIG